MVANFSLDPAVMGMLSKCGSSGRVGVYWLRIYCRERFVPGVEDPIRTDYIMEPVAM